MTPSAPALVHILGILGDGRSINPGERVRIPAPHQRITIRFTKAAEQATREGVAAWQQLQQCLRELAELNKRRNFRRAREGDA